MFSNGTTIVLRKMGPVNIIVLAKQFPHSRAPSKSRTLLQDLDDDDTAFLQKLSCSSLGVPIDSPHVIVFSNGTTIVLRKMGPVNIIVLAKQFPHSRAPNKCCTLLQDLDDDDTAFLQKLSCSSSCVPIDSPHVIVFSNGTTIILRKMGSVHTIVLAKQFPHCKAVPYSSHERRESF